MKGKGSPTYRRGDSFAEESMGSSSTSRVRRGKKITPEKLVSIDNEIDVWTRKYGSESQFRSKFKKILDDFEKDLANFNNHGIVWQKSLYNLRRLQKDALEGVYQAGCWKYSTLDDKDVVFYDDEPLQKAITQLLGANLISSEKKSKLISHEPTWGAKLNSLITNFRDLDRTSKQLKQIIPDDIASEMESRLEEPGSHKGQKSTADERTLRNEIARLVSLIQQLERDLQSTKYAMAHALSSGQKMEIAYRKKLLQLETDRDRASNRAAEDCKVLRSKQAEIDELTKQVNSLNSKIRTESREDRVLKTEDKKILTLLNEELVEVRKRYKKLGENLKEKYQNDLEDYKKGRECELNAEIKALRQALDEERKNNASKVNNKLEDEVTQLKSTNKILDDEIRALKTEVKILSELNNTNPVSRIQELEEEVSSLKDIVDSEAEGAGNYLTSNTGQRKFFLEETSSFGSDFVPEDDREREYT